MQPTHLTQASSECMMPTQNTDSDNKALAHHRNSPTKKKRNANGVSNVHNPASAIARNISQTKASQRRGRNFVRGIRQPSGGTSSSKCIAGDAEQGGVDCGVS